MIELKSKDQKAGACVWHWVTTTPSGLRHLRVVRVLVAALVGKGDKIKGAGSAGYADDPS